MWLPTQFDSLTSTACSAVKLPVGESNVPALKVVLEAWLETNG